MSEAPIKFQIKPELIEAFRAIGKTILEATESLGSIFALVGTTMSEAFTSILGLTTEMQVTNTLTFIRYGEDYVVDVMGISRVDIRELTIHQVRLWNHRRLPIDILDVVDYAIVRLGSRRP